MKRMYEHAVVELHRPWWRDPVYLIRAWWAAFRATGYSFSRVSVVRAF